MSQLESAEVAKEPSMIDEFVGVSTAACGSNHSAFVVDGRVYTYGSNKYGQLGHEPSGETAPAPVELEGGIRAKQVSLGSFHSACVAEDGSLWTWGWGGGFLHGAGGLGHGNSESLAAPVRVERLVELEQEVRQVSCGGQHTVALTTDGLLFATGKGDFGRLGRGDTSDEIDFQEIDYFEHASDSILRPDEQPKIIKIDSGNNFSAVMSEQGELWLWGRNDYGQLGLGDEAMGDMYSAERFPRIVRSLAADGHKIIDFACGEHHIVALTADGVIFEWGNRTWLEPHKVALPSADAEDFADIISVAAGDKFNFALTRSGKLYSWGSKASGCLALGPNIEKNIVQPTPLSRELFRHQKVISITASKHRCMAITDEGEYVA